jgi:hypothetical protein
LHPGESTFSQVEEFSRQYQSQATIEIENGPCTPASCEVDITLANFLARPSYGLERPTYRHWLNTSFFRRLGIRPAEARLFVMVRQNKVEVVYFSAAYESTTGLWTVASWGEFAHFKQGFECEIEAIQRRHPDYLLDYEYGPGQAHQDIFVSACFRKEASEEERKRCRLIRFSCMTSLSDCAKDRSAADRLMPQIYHDLLEDEAIRKADPERYSDTLWNCIKRPVN